MKIQHPSQIQYVGQHLIRNQATNWIVTGILGFDLHSPQRILNQTESVDVLSLNKKYLEMYENWMLKTQGEYLVFAHAQSELPVQNMVVSAQCGPLQKELRVSGPREWEKGLFSWRAGEADFFTDMPLMWSQAYGGEHTLNNPLGVGDDALKQFKNGQTAQLPNIEYLNSIQNSPDQKIASAGFESTHISWNDLKAFEKMGFNDAWIKNGFPAMPDAFDWAIYNRAPVDQRLPHGYWAGDENFRLNGMNAKHQIIEGRLPGVEMLCFSQHHDSEKITTNTMHLDTIVFIPTSGVGFLHYRCEVKNSGALGKDLNHIVLAAQWKDQPKSPSHYFETLTSLLHAQHKNEKLDLDIALMPEACMPLHSTQAVDTHEPMVSDAHTLSEIANASKAETAAPSYVASLKRAALLKDIQAAAATGAVLQGPMAVDVLKPLTDVSHDNAPSLVDEVQQADAAWSREAEGLLEAPEATLDAAENPEQSFSFVKFSSAMENLSQSLETDSSRSVNEIVQEFSQIFNPGQIENEALSNLSSPNKPVSPESRLAMGKAIRACSDQLKFINELNTDSDFSKRLVDHLKLNSPVQSAALFDQLLTLNQVDTDLPMAAQIKSFLPSGLQGLVAASGQQEMLQVAAQWLKSEMPQTQESMGAVDANAKKRNTVKITAPQNSKLDSDAIRLSAAQPEEMHDLMSWLLGAETTSSSVADTKANSSLLDQMASNPLTKDHLQQFKSTLQKHPQFQEFSGVVSDSLNEFKPSEFKDNPVFNALSTSLATGKNLSIAEVLALFDEQAQTPVEPIPNDAADPKWADASSSLSPSLPDVSLSTPEVEPMLEAKSVLEEPEIKNDDNTTEPLTDAQDEPWTAVTSDFLLKIQALSTLASKPPGPVTRHARSLTGFESQDKSTAELHALAAEVISGHARGQSFAGRDLSGIDLSGAQLPGIDLTGALLMGSVFLGANLQGAQCAGSVWIGSNLRGVHAQDANFQGSNFSESLAGDSKWKNADLSQCLFERAQWDHAHLQNVQLNGSEGSHWSLKHADLQHSHCANGDFSDIHLNHAVLDHAQWTQVHLMHGHLSGLSAKNAVLSAAILVGSEGEDIDFSDAVLYKVNAVQCHFPRLKAMGSRSNESSWIDSHLEHCQLQRANFDSAIFNRAQMNDSQLDFISCKKASFVETHLMRASLQHAQLWASLLTIANLKSANLSHANLVGVDFTGTQLESSDLQNANIQNSLLAVQHHG
jgi:uncharacterized protein YjbI with pentapeptide repeats